MATPRFAWGIDVGNRALKAVKLVPTATGLAIDDFDVVEHETVLSAAGDNRDQLITTALATFVGRHPGIEKGQVGVSVNSQRTFNKFIKLPPVERRKIPEIVRFEAVQQIPFPLDDVEWSYQLFEDPTSPEVEVGIFAMRKELVTQHIRQFTDAKLNVQVVQMHPLAVYNAMYYDSRVKGTTMFVDLGAENTDLIIAEGETVWLRSVPIGGDNFTEALTKSFRVNTGKAEEMKRGASTNKYGRQIMQAMRPIFADLVSEIQRSMGFYSSVHKESRITRVVAMGNTFRLPGLQRYLQQNLTLDVEKVGGLGSGAIEDPKAAALFSDNVLSAAGAYGLALQVMGQGKIASNLLPESIRAAKVWREKTKWFAAAAAVFVAGAGVAYGSYYLNKGQFESEASQSAAAKVDHAEVEGTRLSTEYDTKVEQAGAQDRQKLVNVMGLTRGRQVWPDINDLLYNTLPQNDPANKAVATADVAELKKTPRGDRQQILITGLVSKYYPDVNPIMLAVNGVQPDMTIEQPVPAGLVPSVPLPTPATGSDPTAAAGGTAPATPQRGYVVTLECVSPNANGARLFDAYCKSLVAAGPVNGIEVLNARIVNYSKIKDDGAAIGRIVAEYNQRQRQLRIAAGEEGGVPGGGGTGGLSGLTGGGGGMTGLGGLGGRTPPPVGNNVPDEAYLDPVLGEDVRNDTECLIVLTVTIDPAKPKPGAAAPAVAVVTPTPPTVRE